MSLLLKINLQNWALSFSPFLLPSQFQFHFHPILRVINLKKLSNLWIFKFISLYPHIYDHQIVQGSYSHNPFRANYQQASLAFNVKFKLKSFKEIIVSPSVLMFFIVSTSLSFPFPSKT